MSQALIITGMHRSGTSMVSSLLQAAGVHLGDHLLAGNSANPRGYFEDLEIYAFHERLLNARNQTYLYLDSNFSFQPTQEECDEARRLATQRSHVPLWGWKDPRTALFLEFWHQQLPDARFVFIYRHPLQVLLSLLRRGEFDNHPCLTAGLEAWQTYNRHIKAFFDQHAERSLLVHVEGVVRDYSRFAELAGQKLQLDLQCDPEAFAKLFHSDELKQTALPVDVSIILEKVVPGIVELYEALNEAADLPAGAGSHIESATPQMMSLAMFAASMPAAEGEAERQSLLQLLAAQLEPECTETMLLRFRRNSQGAQQLIDHIWRQVQELQKSDAQQCAVLRQQQRQLQAQQSQLEGMRSRLRRDDARPLAGGGKPFTFDGDGRLRPTSSWDALKPTGNGNSDELRT